MDRLIASNSVPLAQADTAPTTGTPQYATDGNPATNVPATLWPAYAFNALQDEIYNVIVAAGLTPNRNAWNQLLTAIETMLQGSTTNVGIDTGAANAYVVAFTPALTAPVPWVPFWFEVKTTNTGASTLNATGTVEPLVGGAHLALQGGELVAKGNALVYWNPTLASGAGSYVLLFCSGAPEQIAPATSSEHAVQLGQVAAVVGTARNVAMSLAAAGTSATWTADEVVVQSALGGISTLVSAINLTFNGATTGAGGMDTGSLPTSGFVGVYLIWGPVVGAKLYGTNAAAKINEVYGGGTGLPLGYTQSALLSIVPTNGSAQMIPCYQDGRSITFPIASAANGSGVVSFTAVGISGLVPVNAKRISGSLSITNSGTGPTALQIFGRSMQASSVTVSITGPSSGSGSSITFTDLILALPQTIYIVTSSSSGAISNYNCSVGTYTF